MRQEQLYHNSQHTDYRHPFGAVMTSKSVTLCLDVKANEVEEVYLVIEDGLNGDKASWLKMHLEYEKDMMKHYDITYHTPEYPTVMWYYFVVNQNGQQYYYGNNHKKLGGEGQLSDKPIPFQITVYEDHYLPPKWLEGKVAYQIFVDRFYNGNEMGRIDHPKKNSLIHSHWENDPIYIKDASGNILMWDFFGGNLLGVKKKIPELAALGIDLIYLNPIFKARSNHKYDTGDYHTIDEMFGNEELFKALCDEATRYGIAIILDGVFSHTGSDSKYFNKEGHYPDLGAYQSAESPYYTWYQFDNYPHQYQCWWGVTDLPNVDELNPSYLDFIIHDRDSVLNHWQRCGIKGWRLDVADELPDPFIKAFKKQLRKNDSEALLIGEVWEDASNKVSYDVQREYLLGSELDSVTNYVFRHVVIEFMLGHIAAMDVKKQLMSLYENYPREHFNSLLNLVGSHDTPRILSVMARNTPIDHRDRIAIRRLKLVALWQILFPGVPCIYYGDEAGLKGEAEPLNRRTYPWGKENKILLDWYKNALKLRKQFNVFQKGDWKPFTFGEDIFGFIREYERQKVIVLINRQWAEQKEVELSSDFSLHQKDQYDLLGQPLNVEHGCISIEPLGCRVIQE